MPKLWHRGREEAGELFVLPCKRGHASQSWGLPEVRGRLAPRWVLLQTPWVHAHSRHWRNNSHEDSGQQATGYGEGANCFRADSRLKPLRVAVDLPGHLLASFSHWEPKFTWAFQLFRKSLQPGCTSHAYCPESGRSSPCSVTGSRTRCPRWPTGASKRWSGGEQLVQGHPHFAELGKLSFPKSVFSRLRFTTVTGRERPTPVLDVLVLSSSMWKKKPRSEEPLVNFLRFKEFGRYSIYKWSPHWEEHMLTLI